LAADFAGGKSPNQQLLFVRAWVDEDGSYTSWQGQAFVVPDSAWFAAYCARHGVAAAGERLGFVQVGADGRTVELGERCAAITVTAGAVIVVERDLEAPRVPPITRAALVQTRGAAFVRGLVTAPARSALPALRFVELEGESEAHEIRGGVAYTFEARPESYDGGASGVVELGTQRRKTELAAPSTGLAPAQN
jgi:hypothetical protein